jgi:hypothetical protein
MPAVIVVEERVNRWDHVIKQFPKVTSAIIGKATFDAYAHSQIDVPVRRPDVVARTGIQGGFLKQSGMPHFRPGAHEGEIRYTAYYAGYVHEGTFRMPPRPWLRNAVDHVMPSIIAAFMQLERRIGA